MYIVYGGQSAGKEHCISQLASGLAEKYVVIKSATKPYTHRCVAFRQSHNKTDYN